MTIEVTEKELASIYEALFVARCTALGDVKITGANPMGEYIWPQYRLQAAARFDTLMRRLDPVIQDQPVQTGGLCWV